jgi:uncharacterized protein YidB (DUF937 family)
MFDKLFGGSGRGGMSPITMALMGLLAYRTLKGKGRLADMLGRSPAGGGMPGANPYGGNAGAPDPRGGALSGGLNDLLKQFQQQGQGDKAESWINRGPNKPVSPPELEQALGEERITWLMQETGLSRQELLDGLSRERAGNVAGVSFSALLSAEALISGYPTSAQRMLSLAIADLSGPGNAFGFVAVRGQA